MSGTPKTQHIKILQHKDRETWPFSSSDSGQKVVKGTEQLRVSRHSNLKGTNLTASNHRYRSNHPGPFVLLVYVLRKEVGVCIVHYVPTSGKYHTTFLVRV